MTASSSLLGNVLPQRSLAQELALIAGGAALTALTAQIQIPTQPVPFTLQTLSVMLCGLAMGARLGALSQLAYLAAGIAGAPVFAGASAGFGKVVGPTGGYLISFVLVAAVLGLASDRGWTRRALPCAAAYATGIVINLGLGTFWLANFIGPSKAVAVGLAPFVGIEVLKALVALPLLPVTWQMVGRSSQPSL